MPRRPSTARPSARPSARPPARPPARPAARAAARAAAEASGAAAAPAAHAPPAPHATEALDALRRIVRVLRLTARSVEHRTGLRAAQLFTLQLVAAEPGLSLTELAQRTMTDRTSVAGMVDRLLARGLVVRRPGVDDRRRTEIFATAKGAAMLARAPRAPTQRVLDGMAAMREDDRRQLALVLRALVDAMGIADEPAPMLFEDPPGARDDAPPPRADRGAAPVTRTDDARTG